MESRRRSPATSTDGRFSSRGHHRRMLLPTLIFSLCLSAYPLQGFADAPNFNTDSDCSKPCDATSYQLQPCRPKSINRRCINVAVSVPEILRYAPDDFVTPTYLEGLEAEATPNVILENLHDTRNLETTYYVTDMTQASDFYWDRESGLRVNIGILNVHLVPEYEDVEHDGGDNKYMLSNPNNVEDRIKYQNVLRQFCRYPIPDHYSITLEISRDRTTTAREIQCNSKDQLDANCPLRHNSSGFYLQRDVNEACQKMGTFPEPLKPAANSIVCTEKTDLLRDLFDQTYSVERSIKFPAKKCRTAISRCEQCLSQARCSNNDSFEKRCCQIDCYTLADCKFALSAECTRAPVECAMGDAYRYTIQPMFHALRADAQCHVRRRQLNVIYELFFFLQLPPTKSRAFESGTAYDAGMPSYGTGEPQFQTPKVHRTVRAAEGDRTFRNRGLYTADYLTVEHATGLDLDDELILRRHDGQSTPSSGPRTSGSAGRGVGYTVRPVTEDGNDESARTGAGRAPSRPPVHEISRNIYVVSTQFEKPFDYSTTSWTTADDCNKNATKMRTVVRHNASDELPVTANVHTSNEPFRYFLKSTENPPYIRFTVPGNSSILPYYFTENSPSLRLDHSLVVHLQLTSSGTVWELSISGHMTGCPSYVAIAVINYNEAEELFRYDALVLCPPSFNVTFRAPNLASSLSAAVPPPYWSRDQDTTSGTTTFHVRLTDPVKTYSVYLTHVELSSPSVDDSRGAELVGRYDRKSKAVAVRTAVEIESKQSSESSIDESVLFAVLAGALLVSVSALTVTLAYADPTTSDGVRQLRSTKFGSSCCNPGKGSCGIPPYGYSYCSSRDAAHRPETHGNDDFPTSASVSRNMTSSETERCGDGNCLPDDSRRFRCNGSSKSKSSSSGNIKILVLAYATLWIVYSCVVTFTAISAAISVFVRPDIDRLQSVVNSFRLLSDRHVTTNESASSTIDRHRVNELRRHAGQLIERRRACATHVDRLYTVWSADVDRSVLGIGGGPDAECRPLSAIGNRLEQRYIERASNYVAALNDYELTLTSRVNEALRRSVDKYNTYLRSIGDSPWTSFVSTSLFNGTLLPVARDDIRRRSDSVIHDVTQLSFGEAFEVDEVTTVDEWSSKFWQRYNRWLPDLPVWPAIDDVMEALSESTTECISSSVDRPPRNVTSLSSSFRELFDSTRFVVSSEPTTRAYRQAAVTSPDSTISSVDEEFYWSTSESVSGTEKAATKKGYDSSTERRKSQTSISSNSKPKRPTSRESLPTGEAASTSVQYPTLTEMTSSLRLLFVAVDCLLVLFHLTRAFCGFRRTFRRYGNADDDEIDAEDRPPPTPDDGRLRNGGSSSVNGYSAPTPAITVDFNRSATVVLPSPDRLIVADWTVEMCPVVGGHESRAVDYFHNDRDKARPVPITSLGNSSLQPPRRPEMDNTRSVAPSDGQRNGPNHVTDADVLASESKKNISVNLRAAVDVLNACVRVTLSRSLLPVLGCAILLTAAHAILRSTCRTLDTELEWNRRRDRLETGSRLWSSDSLNVTSGIDLIGTLYATINRYRTSASNAYVSEETEYLHDVILESYGRGVIDELLHLQAFIQYFTTERLRWSDSYIIDQGGVRRTSNWTQCDVGAQPTTSSTVPIVPCNFVPVGPVIYRDTDIERAEGESVASLWGIFDAVRRLVIVTSYAVLVAMTIALLLRFTLVVVSHRLAVISARSRRADDAKSRSSATIADIICDCFCDRTKSDDTGNYDDGRDVEDDNDAAATAAAAADAPAQSPYHSLNSGGHMFCEPALTDLRYIETKV